MTPLLTRQPAADRQFERIYQRHAADVYRYALAVLRNPADAEDVTQTTFMNAYRAFGRGERPETPKNWLIAIAHNVCRQRFRAQQRRPNEVAFFEDAAESAVVEHENEFTAGDIQRALGQLAFNQRSALVMRELEGRSYAEIAGIMGLTVGAVETLIFRARRALREQLEGTLTCAQAELALSKQTDGVLSRQERGQLRAHLRECGECAALARRSRASRGALKAMLGGIPLPGSLASFFGGGGGSAVGVGLATKAAAVVCAGAVVGSAGYEGARQLKSHPAAVRATSSASRPTRAARATPLATPRAATRPASGAPRQSQLDRPAAPTPRQVARRARRHARRHAVLERGHVGAGRHAALPARSRHAQRAGGNRRSENDVRHARRSVHAPQAENDVQRARSKLPGSSSRSGRSHAARTSEPGAQKPKRSPSSDGHGSAAAKNEQDSRAPQTYTRAAIAATEPDAVEPTVTTEPGGKSSKPRK